MFTGDAESICVGFSGWQVDAKRGRRGCLTARATLPEGDLVGARLTRSLIGQQPRPGRCLLNVGDGTLVTVTVTVTVPADAAWFEESVATAPLRIAADYPYPDITDAKVVMVYAKWSWCMRSRNGSGCCDSYGGRGSIRTRLGGAGRASRAGRKA